jgi:hypothetical protein
MPHQWTKKNKLGVDFGWVKQLKDEEEAIKVVLDDCLA